MARDLTWQPSLLDGSVVELDRSFHGGRRHPLGEDAWVDHVPGWCRGADLLFAELLQNTPWRDREVRMYDRVVPEPRLTHRWHLDRGRTLWVPRTVSRSLTSAFSISRPRGQGPQPAQHDRSLWPSDSPTCCSPVC